MDNERCPKCSAVLAIVGRVHNCKPVSRGVDEAPNQHPSRQGMKAVASPGCGGQGDSVHCAGPRESSTYKYRDPEKRRAQVALAMRAYRARRKANG